MAQVFELSQAQVGTNGGYSWASSATNYVVTANTNMAPNATLANAQITRRTAGTFSHMILRIISNRGAFTLTLQIDGANGNSIITTPTAPSGEYEDTSGTDEISAGQKVNYKGVGGGGGNSQYVYHFGILFSASSDTVVRHAASGSISTIVASTTVYAHIAGPNEKNATEPEVQDKFQAEGTLKNFFVYVSANARTTDTIFKSRKNGADGNLVVTFGSTVTGIQEDTTHSDNIAVDDLVNYSVTTGTGTTSITWEIISTEFVSTGSKFHNVCGTGAGVNSTAASTTQVCGISGTPKFQTTAYEVRVQSKCGVACDASNFSVYVSSNTRVNDTSYYLRVNGSNSTMLVTFGSGVTGWQEDTTHSVSLQTTDELDYAIVTGTGTNAIRLTTINCFFSQGGGPIQSGPHLYQAIGTVTTLRQTNKFFLYSVSAPVTVFRAIQLTAFAITTIGSVAYQTTKVFLTSAVITAIGVVTSFKQINIVRSITAVGSVSVLKKVNKAIAVTAQGICSAVRLVQLAARGATATGVVTYQTMKVFLVSAAATAVGVVTVAKNIFIQRSISAVGVASAIAQKLGEVAVSVFKPLFRPRRRG